MKTAGTSAKNQPLRVALLGSGTLAHAPELLSERCAAHDLDVQWHVVPYQQYQQEALNPKSGFYAFGPDLIIVMVEAKAVLEPQSDAPYRLSQAGRKCWAREAANTLTGLVDALLKRARGIILLHNLEVPTDSPIGILETKQAFGFHEVVRWVNQQLVRRYAEHPQVFVFDYDGFLSRVGKEQAHDERLAYLADMALAPSVWRQLGDEYARYLLAMQGRTKKCLVLDLDNTLWGGILGEDGFDGIQLGTTPLGMAFVAFQRHLLALFERGILLAINSHNHAPEALAVIRKHPAMVLREKHFAAMAINWEDKAKNLRAIAEELNLGLESLIYVDDDPSQRWLISRQAPEVSVVDLPPDPSQYVRALTRQVGFDALQLTAEDQRRGAMYIAERRRQALQRRLPSLDEFLAQLKIRVRVRKADRFSLPRLAQLTQRTNQFHLTLERYTEAELAKWLNQSDHQLYAIEVADRFGDQGISGAVGIRRSNSHWGIPLFLLSCRVLGKGVERAVLGTLIRWAKEDAVEELRCGYVPSDKNTPARRFLEEAGFSCVQKDRSLQSWRLELGHAPAVPAFVDVVTA